MDTTEHPPKRHFLTLLRIVVLFILLVGAFAAYSRFSASQHAGGQQINDTLAVFDSRLQNLETSTLLHEKRLAALEEKEKKPESAPTAEKTSPAAAAPATTPTAAAPSSDADTRIAALEKELSMIKSAPASQGNDAMYAAIHLLSSYHRLSDKVMSGKPFGAELSAFQESAGDNKAIIQPLEVLAPYADSGIPTFAALLASFDDALDQLNAYEATPPAGYSFWQRFVFNLSHLVSVRKLEDDQTGVSINAIVGRAQAHLDREEIEAAIIEIKSLPDAARGNFSGWLEQAQIATDAPVLIDQIEEAMMQEAFHTEAQPVKGAR